MAAALTGSPWAPALHVATGVAAVDRDLGALAPALPSGPPGRGRPGHADPLGLGAGPVSLPDPARPDHPGRGGPAHHPGPGRSGCSWPGGSCFSRR